LRWFAAISADHPEKLEYIIRHGIAELRSYSAMRPIE
jgi:hypothetical protein